MGILPTAWRLSLAPAMCGILYFLGTEDYRSEVRIFGKPIGGGAGSRAVDSVVHIFNGLNPSGMEKMLVAAAQYSPLPIQKVIIVGQGKKNPFSNALAAAGYKVVILPELFTLQGLWALFVLIRATGPSIVHIHSESCYAQAVLVTRLAAGRVVIVRTIHSIFKKKRLAAVYRRVTAAVCDLFVDRFVACSPEVQAFERQFGRRIELVWNWVDDRFFSERDNSLVAAKPSSQLLLVGNCSKIKNHTVVLQALKALMDDNLTFGLSHVGLEDAADSLELGMLDDLDQEGRLIHRGPGDPLPRMLDRPTYLMPSLHEGMGVALAEAIVVGLPAIVADVPGLQWAKEFSNVRHVANDTESWKLALANVGKRTVVLHSTDVERFRAEHGINAYFAIYESALEASNVASFFARVFRK